MAPPPPPPAPPSAIAFLEFWHVFTGMLGQFSAFNLLLALLVGGITQFSRLVWVSIVVSTAGMIANTISDREKPIFTGPTIGFGIVDLICWFVRRPVLSVDGSMERHPIRSRHANPLDRYKKLGSSFTATSS